MALPHAILNHWGNCLIGITATLYFYTFPHKSSHIKYVIGERVSCDNFKQWGFGSQDLPLQACFAANIRKALVTTGLLPSMLWRSWDLPSTAQRWHWEQNVWGWYEVCCDSKTLNPACVQTHTLHMKCTYPNRSILTICSGGNMLPLSMQLNKK